MAVMEVSSCNPCSIGASYGFERSQNIIGRKGNTAKTPRRVNQPNRGQREARILVARGNGSSGENKSGTELSSREFFESFLRSRQANGDFVSKAADALRKKEDVEFDEESRQRVREKLAQLQKAKEVDDNVGFLKLSQARNWSLEQNDATPKDPNFSALEREMARDERKKQSLFEYEALKRELSLMTGGIAIAASAYCFIILSPEAAVSYGIGALASLAYLQLLFRHADEVSEDNVAQIFVQRRRQKRIGITSTDLQESFEKTIRGSSRALSSPRLVIPAALFGLWGVTDHLAGNSPIHLELVPLVVGFFAYKAAALVQAYRDNKDLLFMLDDPKGPKDA